MARILNRDELLAHAGDPASRQRRALLCDLFDAALAAVDPQICTRRAILSLREQGMRLERVTLFALGKAARGMAEAALAELHIDRGIVIALDDAPLAHLRVARGGHPLPADDAELHGAAVLELARSLGPDDLALVLVSGGGSAMLELPVPGVSLADIVATTRLLLGSGARIEEVNAVRAALSELKGGKLARAMPNTPIVNLVLSDVVAGPLAAVASGPTLEPEDSAPSAHEVVTRYGLLAQLPATVRSVLAQAQAPAEARVSRITSVVAADNRLAQDAMVSLARARGWPVKRREAPVLGEAREAAGALLHEAREAGMLYIAGGETTVTLAAAGVGGRNQELALAALRDSAGALVGTLGTDGVDGASSAAGALADAAALGCAQARGLDVSEHLAHHMSGRFFAEAHAAIVTGPTGTNVADVVAIFPALPREN